jgi:B12 binding domain
MLKLFLIHPSPDKNRFGSKRRTRSSMAQINLPLLAGYADRDFEVRIIDENIEDIDFDAQADLVGITTMTSTAFRAYQIGDQFRKRGVCVVMGGIHASLFPEGRPARTPIPLLWARLR